MTIVHGCFWHASCMGLTPVGSLPSCLKGEAIGFSKLVLAADFLFPESVALSDQRPLHELPTATLSARCGSKGSRQAAFR